MSRRRACSRLSIAAMLVLSGCGIVAVPPTASLAPVESVALSTDASTSAALDSGAAGLANSLWTMRMAADDSLIFRVRFGERGQIVEITDNFIFAQPWLGSAITPDGAARPAALPGGQYVSGGYVAEQMDRIGVLGVLHGIWLGQHLGTARLEFFGLRSGDRIDGTMIRTVTIFGVTPFPAPGNAEFGAYATREP